MLYTAKEVFDYVQEDDVKFIRLSFCDIYGKHKNISILPSELKRAFKSGIPFDASAISGFECNEKSDLLLFPDPSTLKVLPYRPSHGKVVRMFCNIKYPDGTQFERDSRYILEQAVTKAHQMGISVEIGSEIEFYLFKTDENGAPTKIPFDNAGYMDVAPDDAGENVRREICLTLLDMGMKPMTSHHEEGPGQNEINFAHSDALTSADNAVNFISAVKAVASRNGLYADFSPKPLEGKSGNGMHINISIRDSAGANVNESFMAGILDHITEITAFLNPTENSYERLGKMKAPKFVTWAESNRSSLIRIPASDEGHRRIELRSPDPSANPYISYALLIYAGLDGINKGMVLPEPINENLFSVSADTSSFKVLPLSLKEALDCARNSKFLSDILQDIVKTYTKM